jgi:hypothetical protein
MPEHPRPESSGNLALLVLVDSRGSYTDLCVIDDTVLIPLRHLGLPYRLHDLAAGPLTVELLANGAAVVIAQARLGLALSQADSALLASAVTEAGVGLVNFDGGALALYKGPLLGLLGLEVDRMPVASDLLRIGSGGDHFITWTQQPGALVRLRRPVTFSQVLRVGRHVTELAQYALGKDQLIFSRHNIPGTAYEPSQFPAILAATCGKGRVVQFMFSPRLWHKDFFGHAMGLDAFFWRSIVWAARKPLVAQMMPPFVTLRVDDAIGRHDLRYTDVMNRHGYHPLISCFVNDLPADLFLFMRAKSEADAVDWDAHALDYYHLIPYNFGIGEYDDDQLAAIFGRVDRWYAEGGFRVPTTCYFHWGEVGVRALPYLKARGRTIIYQPYHMGQLKWERLFPNWWPYGLNSLFYDSHPDDPELYNIGASLPRHIVEPDVLTGCTTWVGESPANDMAKAAQRASLPVRLAVDSGFFAEITTHEQKFAVLTLEEIDRWLGLLAQEIRRFDARLTGHEHAAAYTRARDRSWIAAVSAEPGSDIAVTMGGAADAALELALFQDDGDGIHQSWHPIPPFTEPAGCKVEIRGLR